MQTAISFAYRQTTVKRLYEPAGLHNDMQTK